MADIRLNINFRKHPKVKRLIRQEGEGAGLALVTLWCYTADLFPRGVLAGLDQDDIEEAAEWSGIRGAFLTGLLNHGLMDVDKKGVYSIHDWKDHQNFVYHSPERKEQSQKANEKRWQAKRGISPDRSPDRSAGRNSCQESPSSSSSSSSSSLKEPKPSSTSPDRPVDVASWENGLVRVLEVLEELQVTGTDLNDPAYWKRINSWADSSGQKVYILDELRAYIAWWSVQVGAKKHGKLARGFRNWMASYIRKRENDALREASRASAARK